MPKERLSMRKIREILRLKYELGRSVLKQPLHLIIFSLQPHLLSLQEGLLFLNGSSGGNNPTHQKDKSKTDYKK